jgi:hypothetical protein
VHTGPYTALPEVALTRTEKARQRGRDVACGLAPQISIKQHSIKEAMLNCPILQLIRKPFSFGESERTLRALWIAEGPATKAGKRTIFDPHAQGTVDRFSC